MWTSNHAQQRFHVIVSDHPRIRNGKQFGRIDRVAGSGSFSANGDCRDGVLGGGSAIPVARGLLAPITTLVITQSSLGTALSVSGERFMGTVIGAAVGVVVSSVFAANVIVFGATVLVLGFVSAAAHSSRSAYRFAGVTAAIILLVPRAGSPWKIAIDRFAGVCIGLGVALILTLFWREKEEVSKT